VTVGRLARAAAIVAVLGLASRFLGYIREAVLAGAYGASAEADAFVVSLLIVNSVAAVLLYTLVTLVIPVFQRERAEGGEESAWRLISAAAAWVGIGLIALSSLVAIWPEAPAALFAFEGERRQDAEELIRIMSPALALQGFSALFTAMLQIYGRFAGPAAVGIAFNLGIIVGIAVGGDSIGIAAAGWGVAAGATLQVLLQLPQFRRLMRQGGVRPAITHPRLAGMAVLALPVLAASLLQQVNNFTDKLFASTLEGGKVAALSYANALGQAPRALLLLPLMTPIFPVVARLMAEDRRAEAIGAFRRVAGLIGLVAMPASLIVMLFPQEIAQLAFGYRACKEECVSWTADPLRWYGLAVWGGFFSYLCNRTLSAANRQREIVWATVVTVGVTIGLDAILIGPMDQAGLALAAAIGIYCNVLILLFVLHTRVGGLGLRRLVRQHGRLAVAALAAGGTAWLLEIPLPTGGDSSLDIVAPLLAKLAAATAVQIAVARLLAPVELREARDALMALLRRRRRPPAAPAAS
jgi:putative peptidoglycan lipid II flippase